MLVPPYTRPRLFFQSACIPFQGPYVSPPQIPGQACFWEDRTSVCLHTGPGSECCPLPKYRATASFGSVTDTPVLAMLPSTHHQILVCLHTGPRYSSPQKTGLRPFFQAVTGGMNFHLPHGLDDNAVHQSSGCYTASIRMKAWIWQPVTTDGEQQ